MRKFMTRRVGLTLLVAFTLVALLSVSVGIAADNLKRFNKIAVGNTVFSTGVINLAPSTAATGGIYFGSDTTLYRSAANVLKTDDALTVTGTLTTGTLAFTNATASGTWDVAGNVTMDEDVVLGDASGDAITVTGTMTVAETLALTAGLTVGTTCDVTGASTFDGAMTLGDAAADAITVTGDMTVTEDLVLTAGATVGTTLDVAGASTYDGAMTLGDAAGDTITVTGTATLAETVTMSGAATVGTTLGVTGATTLDGAVTLGDAATDAVISLGQFRLSNVNDNAMDATNGTESDVVYNLDDNKAYVCTVTGTPATWVALN